MATSITDRLTTAIRIADQSVEQARYQQDRNNWILCRDVMLAARDEIAKPQWTVINPPSDPLPGQEYTAAVKLDGRTKEARAAKAQANG